MSNSYINFCFKNLIYDDSCFCGEFYSSDRAVYCCFMFNRKTKECEIWNNSKPMEEIIPLPIEWLEMKLLENGKLNKSECRVCF